MGTFHASTRPYSQVKTSLKADGSGDRLMPSDLFMISGPFDNNHTIPSPQCLSTS